MFFRLIIPLGVLATLAPCSPCQAQLASTVPLSDTTSLVFASVSEGQAIVGTIDDFVARTENLERQIRLGSAEPVSTEQYLDFMKSQVIPWKPNEVEQLSAVVSELRSQLDRFRLPFPEKIYLIRVTEKMEAGAPHCRGASIILPDSFFQQPSQIKTVLCHELFHVLSSHNHELRDKLYAVIGFLPCNEIELPEALKRRRLTNPDAPRLEHFIQLQVGDKTQAVVPVTLTKSDRYQGGGLFQNLDFKLLVLEQTEGKWRPKLEPDGPQLLSPREVPDFTKKIGRNTGYIIHPEETLADNFWMLVLGRPNVPDPWVLEQMKALLSAPPG
jgi:hypothetical protein